MASLRDCKLGTADDARPSTAPPRLVQTVAPPATPPPEAALRPATAVGQSKIPSARPVKVSDIKASPPTSSTKEGLAAWDRWTRAYARTVNFSNLPLTPQGAMMARELKPVAPPLRNDTDFVSQPPEMTALKAFVATLWDKERERASQAALPKVDVAAKEDVTGERKKKKEMSPDDPNYPLYFFEGHRPKLPTVNPLPSKEDQLTKPFPKEMEERWKKGTLNKDVFEMARTEQARKCGENYERPATPSDLDLDGHNDVKEVDVYEVDALCGFHVWGSLLKSAEQPLYMEDIKFSVEKMLAERESNKDCLTEDQKMNLHGMSLIAPNGLRSEHWGRMVRQMKEGEPGEHQTTFLERMKPVYKQLGGDLEHPEIPCVDFRLFILVLIGLAEPENPNKKKKKKGPVPGPGRFETMQQYEARMRLDRAVKVLVQGNDGENKKNRELSWDELFILILAMHLIFIENSHKLHELVRKKVVMMFEKSQENAESEFSSVNIHVFPQRVTSGTELINLVFPTVHEIAALNLDHFPDCFRTPKGQTLLKRLPRKAQYVDCRPGSVEFLVQEMPDNIPKELRGDGFPLLTGKEKEHFKGSDFFDPEVAYDRFHKEAKRCVGIARLREEKRDKERLEQLKAMEDEPFEEESPEAPLVAEWHTEEAQMPAGLLDMDADWAVDAPGANAEAPAALEPQPVDAVSGIAGETEEGAEIFDMPPQPQLLSPPAKPETGETDEGEGFEMPPAPQLLSPPAKPETGETDEGDDLFDMPPPPVLLSPPAKPETGDSDEGDDIFNMPPQPVLLSPPAKPETGETDEGDKGFDIPPPPMLLSPPAKPETGDIEKGLPSGGALMNLSDEDFDIPPPPQLNSPPARPKTGQDVPRLPLVMQHAHEPQPLLPVQPRPDLDDPRFWTYERYQREKSQLKFSSSCCSCETFKESQCKMTILALLFICFGVLAIGMGGGFADSAMNEAMYVLAGVFFFLGCITCCKACIRSQDAEVLEQELNHPDAAIGRPLIDDLV